MEDMEADFWAHQYAENPPKEELADETFDVEAEIAAMAEDDWETVIDER